MPSIKKLAILFNNLNQAMEEGRSQDVIKISSGQLSNIQIIILEQKKS